MPMSEYLELAASTIVDLVDACLHRPTVLAGALAIYFKSKSGGLWIYRKRYTERGNLVLPNTVSSRSDLSFQSELC